MDNSTSFSLQEAAKHVSLHPETLRKEIKKGSLQAALLGKKYVISKIELECWFKKRGGGRLFDGSFLPSASEA